MLIECCFVWEDGSLATREDACVTGDIWCGHLDKKGCVEALARSATKKKTYPAPASQPCMKYASGCKLGTGLMFDWSIFVCLVAR